MKTTIKLALFFTVLISTLQLNAQSIKASSFGFNATDATDAFREAIEADYDTIIIDKQASDWNVKPNKFFNIEDKVIIFEPGVVLRALPNEFSAGNNCLFWHVYPKNLTIIGYGAEFIMNKYELDLPDTVKSEYRHAISIIGGDNITIKGLNIKDACGDGIYIGSGPDMETDYSQNIYLEDIKITNAYRMGLTIISVENFYAKNCFITETKGTLPEAGLGIEPNTANQRLVNVNFENCSFTNNNHSGIFLSLQNIDGNSPPMSINFRDCYLTNNHDYTNKYTATEIQLGSSRNWENPIKGFVNFERVLIENSQWRAVTSKKGSDAYHTTFKDCIFKDIAQNTERQYNPIYLETAGDGTGKNRGHFIGGFDFDNVLISYTSDKPFLQAGYFSGKGVNDIVGSFKVINPKINVDPLYIGTSKDIDVDFSYDIVSKLPLSEVSFSKKNNIAIESIGKPIEYEVNRSGSTTFPLAVSYDIQGEAISGDDFGLLSKSIIIPSNASVNPMEIYPRKDGVSENVENFSLSLQPSSHYTISSENELFFQIHDESGAEVPEEEIELPLRINAGGATAIYQGETFVGDRFFQGGDSFVNSSTVLAELYQSERSSDDSVFNYNIPLPDGTYEITLHFAEIYWGATGGASADIGKRVFDVEIEGDSVLNNFDLNNEIGPETAITKTFKVKVFDGELNMKFHTLGEDGVDQPKLSAFEISEEVPETPSTSLPLRINSGGPTIEVQGDTFIADEYFVGGQSYENVQAKVSNLYKTERSSDEAIFNYNIPLANGTYELKLHFAEIYWGATGGGSGGVSDRIFDVNIEGVTELNNYDIIKEVGTETVIIKTFNIIVSDGELNMTFESQGSDGTDQPKLSAIEILEKSEIQDFDLRINAGGPTVDFKGETFIADQYFSGGQTYENTNATVASLYQTERSSDEAFFSYDIPLENGTYDVTLHLAEIYWGANGGGTGATGVRIFDADIEGVTVLNDYDIYKDVGSQTEVTKTFTVNVTDEVLNLTFDALESDHGDQPKVSAIEITGKVSNGITGIAAAGGSSNIKISNETRPSNLEKNNNIKTINEVQEIVVFPNPTSDRLTIKGIDNLKTITVFSYSGQVLQSLQVSNYETTLDLSGYPSGIYLVQVLDKNKINNFKVVKK
ncbi:malectin domain-containing carbohydrate-binding protein [Algibacter mikhailovii]|uniref:T9SS type A sorting domain-containing protein n=1 Tax=Algibacter mikhailovii TaxID=425498 RepID=A0A918QT49_9FLAO|nr:malectin domain-containing carbohydrate-binding protein [Algibacter mikhailovii]GGZ70295.1 hypothetical protein GCM10007028_04250 [Algibacter mikhailovii]